MGNDRVAAWRLGAPSVVLAGACSHVNLFAKQLGPVSVRLSREDALCWLMQQQTRQLPERVVIFDTCLHATLPQCEQGSCPAWPMQDVYVLSPRAAAAKRLFDLLGVLVLLS